MEDMDHEAVALRGPFGDEQGMVDGYKVVGDDEQATLEAILREMTSPNKPTFLHLIAHGKLDPQGKPQVILADQQAYAKQFKKYAKGNFEGVELVFLNFCYSLSREEKDDYNFAYVIVKEMKATAVVGTHGSPQGWAAANMAIFFWSFVFDCNARIPMHRETLYPQLPALLEGSKEKTKLYLIECIYNATELQEELLDSLDDFIDWLTACVELVPGIGDAAGFIAQAIQYFTFEAAQAFIDWLYETSINMAKKSIDSYDFRYFEDFPDEWSGGKWYDMIW